MRPQKAPIPHGLLEHLLDSEKLKYCFECGICTASCPIAELFPKHYNPRILLEEIFHNPEKALRDEALWLCAWCYRCYKRCPQKVKLPDVLLSIRKIAKEQGHVQGFEQALDTLSQEIPLPASFALVCLHPERVELNNITEILDKHPARRPKKARTLPSTEKAGTKRVAIIGSGPTGLTAANELLEKGYSVTVFESSSQPGGMLKQCIPEFRLPRSFLDKEIQHMKDMGVEIKTNITIGKDITLDKLWEQGFNAILVSVGAHKTRKLSVEGENLNGVYDALDFLRKANNKQQGKLGERVAVIGGGNVAIDSARTALRLGVKEVTVFYRRSKEEMPANPYEIIEAEQEGVKIQFLSAPKRVIGGNEQVTGLECIKMTLGEPDQTGRRAPKPVEGSEFIVPMDTVILAIGEAPDLSFLSKEIELTDENTIEVEPFSAKTSQLGIFAGGDCVTGPATFIEAVLAGKRAAEYVDQYLRRERVPLKEKVIERRK